MTTYYVDASVQIAVRTALADLRDDVLYAGGPNAPAEDTPDRIWLAEAGRNGWIAVMRDKHVRRRRWEREALVEAGVRAFCMTGAGNLSRWETLRLLAMRWPRLEEVVATEGGPYIYAVTWEGVRRLGVGRT